ncbi:MAG: sulfur-oxidizing protein SoxA [Candidatus Azotimanducaceae bacterium]|jgi:sulfur-oxidizing protein SoxA
MSWRSLFLLRALLRVSRRVLRRVPAIFLLSVLGLAPLTSTPAAEPLLKLIPEPVPKPIYRQGYDYQSSDIQSLQDDPFSNPGMLWVDEGRELFDQPAGAKGQSCRDCHNEPGGVAARYPGVNRRLNKLVSLTGQVQICRETHQNAEPIAHESRTALALTAYLAYLSRGRPFEPVPESLEAELDQGRDYYYQRKGQLNLSCAQCHEQNAGQHLRGDLISEGQSTGYPLYRLEWQTLGSLHRRFRACDIGVRAEPFGLGSEPYNRLELYLRSRSQLLPISAPAVRK